MKVLEVDPGYVSNRGDHWTFAIRYRRRDGWWTHHFGNRFASAADAKQAMREKVAHERKRHGLQEANRL